MKKAQEAINKTSEQVKKLLAKIEKDADRVIYLPIAAYTLFFSAYTCYMHYTFKTYAWDLGIITQSLWTTLNSGKILYSTLEVHYGNPSGNFLGVHFSPILFLILPIYALYQSPETLLIFQSFILALAALPLYWIARDKIGKKLYALAFATAYMLNPALHGVNTFDFHLEIFTPLFILLAFYYIEKNQWIKAAPFLILELITIEFAPLIVFSLGLYFLLKKIKENSTEKHPMTVKIKKLAAPIALMIMGLFSFYFALYAIATVNPLKTGGTYRVWNYWGSNVFEVIQNVIRNPNEVLIVLLTPIEKPYFLFFLFSCTLFLPLFAPLELIIIIPWLFAAFLTDYQPYYQPYYQYTAFILGQLFIAAIYGFKKLFPYNSNTNNKEKIQKKIITAMLVVNVLILFAISPVGIPAFTSRSIRPYAITSIIDSNHIAELHKVLTLIPSNASIATIHEIFPHVCQRLHAYILKWPLDYDVEYILIDVKSPTFTWAIQGPTPDQITINLMKEKSYGVVASSDGIMLLKKDYNGTLQYYTPQRDTFDYQTLIPLIGEIKWDYTSTSKKIIINNPEYSPGYIWYGPYKYFVPGTYNATFKIKTSNENSQILLDIVTNHGDTIMAQRIINGTEFHLMNTWQEFTFSFKIDEITQLELRGKCLSTNTQVAIDYVKVEQENP